jgi:anthranilate synthase/aminodeoxychorismate synthase-like glutamine amidotransferase
MLLLIDNYDSFTYNLYQALCLAGQRVEVARNDRISLEQAEKMPLKGIVLSPGPGRPEEAGLCIELIQKLGSRIPILGICLGHQAIAAAFGEKVVSAKGILHGKASEITHSGGVLFAGMTPTFKAGRYHSLIVDLQPSSKELKVDALDADGTVMALSHRTYPIFGLQFHPESILTPDGHTMIQNFTNFCTLKEMR